MTEKNSSRKRPPLTAWTGICIVAGLILGAIVGALLDSPGLWITIGVALGIICAAILMKKDNSGGMV